MTKFFLPFLTVGAISAVINFASFVIFWRVLHLDCQLAVSIAYILSVAFHFLANRIFTFKSSDVSLYLQLPKYLVMVLVNYLITLIVMDVVVEKFHLLPYFGSITAIGMTVLGGYLMSKYWVFVKE